MLIAHQLPKGRILSYSDLCTATGILTTHLPMLLTVITPCCVCCAAVVCVFLPRPLAFYFCVCMRVLLTRSVVPNSSRVVKKIGVNGLYLFIFLPWRSKDGESDATLLVWKTRCFYLVCNLWWVSRIEIPELTCNFLFFCFVFLFNLP